MIKKLLKNSLVIVVLASCTVAVSMHRVARITGHVHPAKHEASSKCHASVYAASRNIQESVRLLGLYAC